MIIISITPSPSKRGVGVMGRRPGPGLNPPEQGDVIPNLPASGGEGTPALQDGEEVSRSCGAFSEKFLKLGAYTPIGDPRVSEIRGVLKSR